MARVHVPAHEVWTDDLDGSSAARTIELKTDQGARYRIDLSRDNYAEWIAPLVKAGTPLARSAGSTRKVAARRSAAAVRKKSAYAKLSSKDRKALREYLGRGNSRGSIRNAEVDSWITAGKPSGQKARRAPRRRQGTPQTHRGSK